MPDREEIVRSLTGAWDLFRDRPDAMRYFDVSVEGFWRSFGAIVLIVPLYVITVIAERQVLVADPIVAATLSDPAFFLAKAFALCLDWVALPVILALAARPLGVERSYSAYIVARNWGAVIAISPFALVALLFALGVLGMDMTNYLSLAALFIILRYNYLIARRALGASVGLAVAIIVFDLFLSLSIGIGVDILFGV
jgi:hypothetical protein